MWDLDYKESWAPTNCCFWTVVLRRLLRVPWTARRSNQSILKEISPGCSLEGMTLKLKLQYFGHLMWRVDSLEKTDAGRDWGQEEKGTTEDEMTGWPHWLDGRESEWTQRVGDGQGGLVCCDSWGRKESAPCIRCQSIGASASVSVLPMNTQGWFPFWLIRSPCSPRDSQVPTPQFKSINSLALSFLHSPTLTSIHDHWKNHSLD